VGDGARGAAGVNGRLSKHQISAIDGVRSRAIEIASLDNPVAAARAREIADLAAEIMEEHRSTPPGLGPQYDLPAYNQACKLMGGVRADVTLTRGERRAALRALGEMRDYVRRRRK